MTQSPAGWHPDPHVPGQQRFWDGASWTDQVAPASAYGAPAYGGGPGHGGPATTPDGQLLAGWWRRVGASLIDGLVLLVANLVVGWTWWGEVFSEYGDFFEETVDAADSGGTGPSNADLISAIGDELLALTLVYVVLTFAYNVGFLAWKQATPGKLALGMRVRLRDRPGPLPLPTILVRWLVQNGPGLLRVVPLVGVLANLFLLLDALWPLWDSKKQALHDKAARTNVVMHRRD